MPDPFLVVDASFDENLKMAGIAAAWDTGRVIATEVASAPNGNVAEVLAAIRATSFLAARQEHGLTIVTDAVFIIDCLYGDGQRGDQMVMARIKDLRRFLERREATMRYGERREVKAAHNAARGALKAWKAGRKEESTWRCPVEVT
jgi:ribonuclease HI